MNSTERREDLPTKPGYTIGSDTPQTFPCPHCNGSIYPEDRYCGDCGHAICPQCHGYGYVSDLMGGVDQCDACEWGEVIELSGEVSPRTQAGIDAGIYPF